MQPQSARTVDVTDADDSIESGLRSRQSLELTPVPEPADDARLLEQCGLGSEEAWSTLVERYQGLVYATALDVGLDADDAADVFQYVWVELHRSIPRFRDPKALPRWLVVATRRHSYKVATRGRKLIRGTFDEMVDPSSLPCEEVEAAEDRSRVESALHALDERCRWFLHRLFFSQQKVSYEQVAREAGLAMGTVGPLRVRCLKKLREVLGGTR